MKKKAPMRKMLPMKKMLRRHSLSHAPQKAPLGSSLGDLGRTLSTAALYALEKSTLLDESEKLRAVGCDDPLGILRLPKDDPKRERWEALMVLADAKAETRSADATLLRAGALFVAGLLLRPER